MIISMAWLDGKKMYILGAGAVLYGILGLILGYLTLDEAKNYIFIGLGMWATKSAINKVV